MAMIDTRYLFQRLAEVPVFEKPIKEGTTQDYRDLIELFWTYYKEARRHSYHDITEFVIETFQEPADYEEVSFLSSKLQTMLVIVSDHMNSVNKCSYNNWDCPKTFLSDAPCPRGEKKLEKHDDDISLTCYEARLAHRFISKFDDHLKLELARLYEIRGDQQELLDHYAEITEDIHENIEKQIKLEKEIKQENRKLKRQAIEIQKETKGIYIHIISVLSIFAAVIIAVFGGISLFSTSIQEFSSIWQAVFLLSTGFMFVYNITFTVLYFMAKVYIRSKFPDILWDLCVWVNLVSIAGIIVSIFNLAAAG